MAPTTKVLVVEDDRHAREMVRRILERDVKLRHLDIEVIQAADGEEGIERFLDHGPDLVIVDLLLPRVNGFKVIETIRAQPAGGDCPILVITGVYRDRKTLKQLEAQGVTLQLKPFLPQVLANTVRRLLVRPREARPAPPPSPSPRASLMEMARAVEPDEGHAGGQVIEGDIAELGLPHLLLDALEEQLTGSLEVRRGKVRKVIHLVAGHPIFVQSNLRSETLGQMLVRRGKVSPDQHSAAFELSKKEGTKYGEALVRLGLMSEREVMDELGEQTRLKITACLAWRAGRFVFTEDPEVGRKVPRCLVEPVQLIFEGLQRHADVEKAFARLASKSRQVVRLTPRFSLYRDRFEGLFGTTVSSVITQELPVQEVIRRAGTPQTAALQLDLMLRTGLAELGPEAQVADEEPLAPAREEAAMPLEGLAALEAGPALEPEAPPDAWEESSAVVWLPLAERAPRRDVDADDVRVALQLIESTYLTLHEADHYQILSVTPHSDADSIEVAHQIKRRQFDLSKFREMDLGEHYAHLEEICAALDSAYAVLGDPARRAAYDASRGKSPSQEERSLALTAEMHCRRGEELFNRERYDKALEAFAQAMELDEQSEYISKYALALFMARRGRDEEQAAAEAMLVVQQALATDGGERTAHLVAATICQEVGHADEAVHHLEELVQIDPTSGEAFDQLERLLLERGDLDGLELQYRRTLHLLGDRNRELAGALWRRLALLYRDELGDQDRARTAFEVALRFAPNDRALREQLTALEHSQPERWPQAVLGYRALLASDPGEPAPIHRLFDLHLRGGRTDAAFVVASVAAHDGVADEPERRLLQRLRPPAPRRARQPLEPSLLERLRHPDDDPTMAALFHVLAPVIEQLDPLDLTALGVEQKEIIPRGHLPEGFASVMRYTAEQLAVELPNVSLHPELGADVQSAGSDPPLLLCGFEALELSDRFALMFLMGRALYRLGPGRRLAAWRSRRTLRDYLLAALSATFPDLKVPDAAGTVGYVREEIGRFGLEPAVKGAVSALRKRASEERGGGTFNLADWQRGIQRSAERVGLLLCTDLPTALRVIAAQDRGAERELVDFALGQAYTALRAELGLSVE